MLFITIMKADSTGDISCEFSELIKIGRRTSLEESLFSKVIGEISTLQNSVKISITCFGVFQKGVLLEISRNLQFAMLTPNNFLKCLD